MLGVDFKRVDGQGLGLGGDYFMKGNDVESITKLLKEHEVPLSAERARSAAVGCQGQQTYA